MANIKISELTALTPPDAADLVPVTDASASQTKRTTVGEIVGIINGDVDVADDGTATISELPVSKLQDGDARQLLQTDAAGTGVEWTSNVDVPGTLDVTGAATLDSTLGVTGQSTLASAAVSDLTSGRVVLAGTSGELEDNAKLTFNGTQLDVDGNVVITGDLTVEGASTILETETVKVEDKNIELGVVASPTDVTADGGGITLKGAIDKTINWVNATDAWTSSERFSVPLGSEAAPSLTFTGDPNTGIYSPGADQVAISTNGTGRLFVDASGNVGVGTTGAQESLHVVSATDNQGAIIENSTGRASLTVKSAATTSSSYVNFGNSNGNSRAFIDYRESLNRLSISTSTASGELVFATGSQSEGFRIDSSGRLLVGTSSSVLNGSTSAGKLQVADTVSTAIISAATWVNNANGSLFVLGKSRSTTPGSYTIVNDNDLIGALRFAADDGTDLQTRAAEIKAEVDGTPGADDMPGRLVFSTTSDGASSPTERLAITSDGSVTTNRSFTATGSGSDDGISFFQGSVIAVSRESDVCAAFRRRSSDGQIVIFRRNTTQVGNISVTTTATAYNTSSDYRLKENVTAVTDGINRLQQLKPSRFNFIADPDTVVDGFIAHEVQAIVPEAITGEKDAVDDEGNPVYQGIDQSKLVPLLTAALQEAVAEINALKDRLTAAGI